MITHWTPIEFLGDDELRTYERVTFGLAWGSPQLRLMPPVGECVDLRVNGVVKAYRLVRRIDSSDGVNVELHSLEVEEAIMAQRRE